MKTYELAKNEDSLTVIEWADREIERRKCSDNKRQEIINIVLDDFEKLISLDESDATVNRIEHIKKNGQFCGIYLTDKSEWIQGRTIPEQRRIWAHYEMELRTMDATHMPVPKTTERMFWCWVAELITKCFNYDDRLVAMNDCMGHLMSRVKGSNEGCTEILNIFEEKDNFYEHYRDNLLIGNKAADSGRYFTELLSSDNWYEKESVAIVLSDFADEVSPYIFNEARKFLFAYMYEDLDDDRLNKADRNFKKFGKKYKILAAELKAV